MDERALLTHVEALTIRDEVLPAGHPDIIMSLERLAIAYFLTEDREQALEMSERVGHVTMDGNGLGNPDIESALSACSALAVACGDLELAKTLLEQTEMVRGGFSGPDSYTKVRTLVNYASYAGLAR